jgi:hypothetical protein
MTLMSNGHAYQQVHAVQSWYAQLSSMVQNWFLPKQTRADKQQPHNNVVMQRFRAKPSPLHLSMTAL